MTKLQEAISKVYRADHLKIIKEIVECSDTRAVVILEGIMEQPKFIQKAIKKPGALRKQLKVKKGQTIPKSDINDIIKRLKKKAAGDKTLSKPELTLLRRANLAKTLQSF